MLSAVSIPHSQYIVEEKQGIVVSIPNQPLMQQSLSVGPMQNKPFVNWTSAEHVVSFEALRKISRVWQQTNLTDQFMVYGKQETMSKEFTWESVPYSKTNSLLGRIWQQFLVLWRIAFGGLNTDEQTKESLLARYQRDFQADSDPRNSVMDSIVGEDAFCKQEVIEKQLVWEGKLVNVLYNYAPIGFGGEKLHFLLVPKAHKTTFRELSQEEYLEAMELTKGFMQHFYQDQSRTIHDTYLFHKTGVDAGQTVPHWHMHMIFTTSKTQDFFGKLTVVKNILFGSSPLSKAALEEKTTALRKELARDF